MQDEGDSSPRYCAYLLRCWETPGQRPARPTTWRFSVEDIHTGERRGFASVQALIDFLETELASEEEAVPAQPGD